MNTKRIGLALGSGGWRGLAHIGVIKSLIKHGFEVNAIAGSSAGALIGGLYCLWNDIEKVEAAFDSLQYKDLLFAFSDPTNGLGLFRGQRTLALIKKYTQDNLIEDLLIPFAAIATDVLKGEKYVFSQGDLAFAIRASSSIPIVFEPVRRRARLFVDGGIVNPLPVHEVKKLGAEIVIGVNVYQCIFPVSKDIKSITKLDLAMISYQLMLNQLAVRDAELSDIYLTPTLENAQSDPFMHFVNNKQAISAGEEAMDREIEKLADLIKQHN